MPARLRKWVLIVAGLFALGASSTKAEMSLSAAVLSAAVTAAMPETFHVNGTPRICVDATATAQDTIHRRIGGDIGRALGGVVARFAHSRQAQSLHHVCGNVAFDAEARRLTSVSIASTDAGWRASTFVEIDGVAGLPGPLARSLKMDRKNIHGTAHVVADVSIGVEHLCPRIQSTTSFVWGDKAALEVLHGVWVPIDGLIAHEVKTQLSTAVAKGLAHLTCGSKA